MKKQQNAQQQKHQEGQVEILELTLTNVGKQHNSESLKSQLFQNAHVIRLETQTDNIKGICEGKANVVIRCPDEMKKNQIFSQLLDNGVKY